MIPAGIFYARAIDGSVVPDDSGQLAVSVTFRVLDGHYEGETVVWSAPLDDLKTVAGLRACGCTFPDGDPCNLSGLEERRVAIKCVTPREGGRKGAPRVKFVTSTEKPAPARPGRFRRASDPIGLTEAEVGALDERLASAIEATRMSLRRWGEQFVLPHMERDEFAAFERRAGVRLSGGGDRAARSPAIRRAMRALSPPFAEHPSIERLVFTRPLGPSLCIAIGFVDVHQWGLSKSFQVLVGLIEPEGIAERAMAFVEHDLANLVAEPQPKERARTWAYADRAELTEAVGGIVRLLESALPVLEPPLVAAAGTAEPT